MILDFGHVGPLQLDRNAYRADFESLLSELAKDTVVALTPTCPHNLGDSKCGLDVDGSPSFTFTGSVTGSASRSVFTDTSRGEADNYFTGGLLTWTSGANAGLQREVQKYELSGSPLTPTFTLFEPMPNAISTSPQDAYQVVAGCDKAPDTCRTKFNNYVNFGGYEYLPGQSHILSVANQRKT